MKLRDWRLSKDLTGESAAALIGVSPSSLSKWERDISLPRKKTVARIKQITNGAVTAADFYQSVAA